MKLADWLSENGVSKAEFARLVGVTAGAITGYCDGSLWPKRPVMERIVEKTKDGRNGGVTADDFLHREAAE